MNNLFHTRKYLYIAIVFFVAAILVKVLVHLDTLNDFPQIPLHVPYDVSACSMGQGYDCFFPAPAPSPNQHYGPKIFNVFVGLSATSIFVYVILSVVNYKRKQNLPNANEKIRSEHE